MIRLRAQERYAPLVSDPLPIALCLHELPDGSAHVDLLVARADLPTGDDDRTVRAWRCAERPDALEPGGTLAIEALPDHRGIYLRLATARTLDRGRGSVTPLRRGAASSRDDRLAIRWSDGGRSLWRLPTDCHAPLLVAEDPAAIPDSAFPRGFVA
jgi:hypothetical protein